MKNCFYNTQHSPIGAWSSFTLGAKGAKGGIGLELGKPADQNIFIGVENSRGDTFSTLPFFDVVLDKSANFDVSAKKKKSLQTIHTYADRHISRQLTPHLDSWEAGDLKFDIYTPVTSAPDPKTSSDRDMALAYVPALAVELTVDNRKGKNSRRFFFGFQGKDPSREMWRLDETTGGDVVGIACGESTAIASGSPDVSSILGFTVEHILAEKYEENRQWGLGTMGLLVGTVPAGVKRTYTFAVCFYRGGTVTTGMEASYFYNRFFKNIEAVASYALINFKALKARGEDFEKRVSQSTLSPERRFMLAQAVHSYFGSTELLDVNGKLMWIVNEGEYKMMNTFDLTVDQLFFEMELNPWTVANELNWFAERYSYTDRVLFPGETKSYPGGLSFTHDMGVANHFSRPGFSTYEKTGLHGCFSFMTHEELVNWLTCGLVYEKKTLDLHWLKKMRPVFEECLESMLQRDNPSPEKRDGVMALDSSRCSGGSEITTYDSLDVSLGQSRSNLYLAVKCWGVYVGLEAMFGKLRDVRRAEICWQQAERCARTIVSVVDAEGFIPALLHEKTSSRLIPAIEGLIIPYSLGLKKALSEKGPYGKLISALRIHLKQVLKPGICIGSKGGWKISSTSDNTWLSKVYLCQFVAEKILGFAPDQKADKTHASWLLDERNSYWAWSDQMISGEAKGSKYYPRGVTSVLWLS